MQRNTVCELQEFLFESVGAVNVHSGVDFVYVLKGMVNRTIRLVPASTCDVFGCNSTRHSTSGLLRYEGSDACPFARLRSRKETFTLG